MKIFKRTFILLVYLTILFLIPCKSFTASMSGSDIKWRCIGHDSFLITLVTYLDCNGSIGVPPSLNINCNSTGTSLGTLTMTNTSVIDITPVCTGSCTRCTNPSCTFPYGINKYTYTGLLVLTTAGSCCDILVSWSLCCRTGAITTGPTNNNFYNEARLNRCLSPCDNSPEFANPGISIICIGQDFTYSPAISDPDTNSSGVILDSFIYNWTQPLQSSGTPVTWLSPYNYNLPIFFWGFPNSTLAFPRGFHLDSITGAISFRPMKIEVTIMAVKVSEYRNKVKIGELQREMEVIVINCPNNHAPSLGPAVYYKEVCAGNPVTFTIVTNDLDPNDTLTISWNHGIKGATWTDSNGLSNHPTGTFTWTPTAKQVSTMPYNFTVTVKDNACPVPGSYTHAYQVLVKPGPKANISITDSCGGNFYMSAHTIIGSGPIFTWTRDSLPEKFNYTGALVHHRFSATGAYPFTMNMTAQGCSTIYHDTFFVNSFFYALLPKDTQVCAGSIINIKGKYYRAKGRVKMSWNTSPNDTTDQVTVRIDTNKLLIFTVTDTSGCTVNDSMKITAIKPIIIIGSLPSLCENDTILHLDNYVTVNGNHKPGAGIWSCSTHGFTSPDLFDPKLSGYGTFKIKYEFTDSLTGCYNSDSSFITVNSSPHAWFGATPTNGSLPMTVYFKDSSTISSGSIQYYLWDFGNGDTSTSKNPNYTYFAAGTYTVRLGVLSDQGCFDTVSRINYIKIIPVSISDHNIFETVSIKPNPAFDYTIISVNGNNTKIESVTLTNSLGKIILLQNKLYVYEFKINRPNGETGIYFLKLKLSDNKIINAKILFE